MDEILIAQGEIKTVIRKLSNYLKQLITIPRMSKSLATSTGRWAMVIFGAYVKNEAQGILCMLGTPAGW